MSDWRVGNHYQIHVYEGDRPVATFHNPEDAQRAVRAVNGNDWQPIETAPKDGTSILIHKGLSMTVALWNGDEWSDGTGLYLRPTHWMPLPDLPRKS